MNKIDIYLQLDSILISTEARFCVLLEMYNDKYFFKENLLFLYRRDKHISSGHFLIRKIHRDAPH